MRVDAIHLSALKGTPIKINYPAKPDLHGGAYHNNRIFCKEFFVRSIFESS